MTPTSEDCPTQLEVTQLKVQAALSTLLFLLEPSTHEQTHYHLVTHDN